MMSMLTNSINKNHWYDGSFYDRLIAPNQKFLFNQIIKSIEPNSSIIDVGCGTGFFSFSAKEKAKSILGIDLSARNIDTARRKLAHQPHDKLRFLHANIEQIIASGEHFDYAVMTYVIHEVNENERIDLLRNISNVAEEIIIGDYLIPQPKTLSGLLTEVVEFIAGKEHYQNFKTYEATGGLAYLAAKADLKIEHEIKNTTNQIVTLKKSTKK
jgi:demethylmenaquinone methyltransferase/2-methoxy-6-polyprenyl-1,4-benzoquinol methylase